jgi:putative addiction module CopG family antidote
MKVEISSESQKFIELTVASGAYANEQEVVDAAISLLREQEQLRQHLAKAMASETIPAEVVFERLERRAKEIASRAQ